MSNHFGSLYMKGLRPKFSEESLAISLFNTIFIAVRNFTESLSITYCFLNITMGNSIPIKSLIHIRNWKWLGMLIQGSLIITNAYLPSTESNLLINSAHVSILVATCQDSNDKRLRYLPQMGITCKCLLRSSIPKYNWLPSYTLLGKNKSGKVTKFSKYFFFAQCTPQRFFLA